MHTSQIQVYAVVIRGIVMISSKKYALQSKTCNSSKNDYFWCHLKAKLVFSKKIFLLLSWPQNKLNDIYIVLLSDDLNRNTSHDIN